MSSERIRLTLAREIQDYATSFRDDTPLTAAFVALYEAMKRWKIATMWAAYRAITAILREKGVCDE